MRLFQASACLRSGITTTYPAPGSAAVQYGLPAIWLVWNNGGVVSIRDQQRGYFGPELATSFRYAASGEPYRRDFAAMARAMVSRARLRLARPVNTDP